MGAFRTVTAGLHRTADVAFGLDAVVGTSWAAVTVSQAMLTPTSFAYLKYLCLALLRQLRHFSSAGIITIN